MKKLLIFILVIAIAPVANAGISLSVNGAPAPGTIYLNGPSSTITLDILMDEPQFAGGDMPAAILRLCSATLRVRWITAV